MRAELLMIGTELLIGQIEDTNSTYMSRVLAEHGIHCYQKTTVGDNLDRIMACLDAALDRCDVVLCSGGLGPTDDDITRDAVAGLFGLPLVYHEELFEAIRSRFARIRRTITDNNKKQALLPEGAQAIGNPHGTAPGVLLETDRGVIACMPGVPSELKPMLEEQIIPFLRERFGLPGVLRYRVLKVCGVGESRVDSMLGGLINAQQNPTIGLLASPEAVRIRIAAHAATPEAAEALIDPVAARIEALLPGLVMGTDDDTLEGVVDRLLSERGWKLAVAETFTGGMVAQRFVAAGAACFAGGRVFPVTDPGTDAARERAIAQLDGVLLDYGSDCALSLVHAPGQQCTYAAFRTPEDCHEFVVGQYGAGARGQLRTSVSTLEQVRRILLGHPGLETT